MKDLKRYLISWLNAEGLEALEEYDIRVATDDRFPNLYNLKYGTIFANKDLPIVHACRGAVVEKVGDEFRLVAYAFDRFFNLGEPQAAEIDWATAKVYEKYDGSLIKLFHWNGKWIVSTSGSVGGAGTVGSSEKSFEELFWETFYNVGYSKWNLDTDNCYVFELCCPENRIVVNYQKPELRLLAVRNTKDGFVELPLCDFEECFNVAKSYDFGAEALLDAVNARGADHEGFVVCDAAGNRLKVKSDVYVQMHRVRGNGEPDFVKLWKNDDLSEFLLHFPEYEPKFSGYIRKLENLDLGAANFVGLNQNLDQKEFAAETLEQWPEVSGGIFALRKGSVLFLSQWLAQCSDKKVAQVLEG